MARVMIVDDSPTELVAPRAILEEDSHEVQSANDGEAALEIISEAPPDVVVTDLQMPRMNGLELVKHLRRTHPQIPVILITAYGSEELSVEALKVGAAAFLPKSEIQAELRGIVNHVLELMDTDYSYKDLIDRLDYHELKFTLENDPKLIGPLVNLLQQMAAGVQVYDDVTRARVGMALERDIIRAVALPLVILVVPRGERCGYRMGLVKRDVVSCR